jgi:hypothetical protein
LVSGVFKVAINRSVLVGVRERRNERGEGGVGRGGTERRGGKGREGEERREEGEGEDATLCCREALHFGQGKREEGGEGRRMDEEWREGGKEWRGGTILYHSAVGKELQLRDRNEGIDQIQVPPQILPCLRGRHG